MDVVGGDLVSGGGVEPVSDEAALVVAGQAADPDARRRVGGGWCDVFSIFSPLVLYLRIPSQLRGLA